MNTEINVNIHTASMVVSADPVTSRNADGVFQSIFYGDSHYWTKGNEETNYFRVVAFGAASEIIQRLVRDGSQVLVSGPSRIRDEPDRPCTEFVAPPTIKVLPEGGANES